MAERKKVTIVGAGLMGTGIAHAFATTGRQVVLVDTSSAALDKAANEIKKIIDDGVRLRKLDAGRGQAARQSLTTTNDLAAASDGTALLIETATESLDVKKLILREAAKRLPEDAVIPLRLLSVFQPDKAA